MEGDGQGAGECDEFAGLFDVNGVVAVEDAEGEAVHSAGFGEIDFGAHLGEFGDGVDEVFVARANHGEDGDFYCSAGFAHEVFGGSDAADGEEFAELDAVGAASFSRDGGSEGFDGDFEEEAGGGHGVGGTVGSVGGGIRPSIPPAHTAVWNDTLGKKQIPNPAISARVRNDTQEWE